MNFQHWQDTAEFYEDDLPFDPRDNGQECPTCGGNDTYMVRDDPEEPVYECMDCGERFVT